MPARAQTNDVDIPGRETSDVERTSRAAGAAVDFTAIENGGDVTYEDVLKNPDNVELNYRFARKQVREGNVRGAAATLERILLINPDLHQVRLFYAIVLYRLGNLDEAEREFQLLKEQDVPSDIGVQIDQYLSSIALARRTTRYSASASLGIHYDTNRAAAPRSETVLFLDIPLPANDDEDDFGFLGIGTIRVDHDLGYQDRHEIFGSFTYYHDEQVQLDSQDLQSALVEGGATLRNLAWGITAVPTAFLQHIRLSRETFFRAFGLDLRLNRDFTTLAKAYIGMRLADQDYGVIAENGTSPLRDGRQLEGFLGGHYVLSPTMRIGAEYLHFDKNAKAQFFAYQRHRLQATHTWLLGDGQFLSNLLSYHVDLYDRSDAFVSAKTRRDEVYRWRGTYGAPIFFFADLITGNGNLPPSIADITASFSLERFRSNSNITNFDYDNWKVQLLFTKNFNF